MALPIVSGIYGIRCVATGKVYVGRSIDIRRRWKTHQRQLELSTHDNEHLQRAWAKYGAEAFVFELLVEGSRETLPALEAEYCIRLGALNPATGFNKERIDPDTAKIQMADETKEKIRQALRGRGDETHTTEWRRKVSEANKGRILDPEWRARISGAKLANPYVVSEEVRQKMSEQRRGRSNGPHSEATKAKMRDAALRRPCKPKPEPLPEDPEKETKRRAKISAALKGRPGRIVPEEECVKRCGRKPTDEARAKMSQAHKGKPKSAEHRANISLALKGKPKAAEHLAKIAETIKARSLKKIPVGSGEQLEEV